MYVECTAHYKNSYPEGWMSVDQPKMKEEILPMFITTIAMKVMVHSNMFQHCTVTNRTVYREATIQISQRKMGESVKQLTKHQQVCTTEEDEEKQFVLQKNGGYALTLSKKKNMVLGLFKGNVYAHFWDNRNKKHVSLNCNELTCLLTNRAAIGEITELLKMEDKQ